MQKNDTSHGINAAVKRLANLSGESQLSAKLSDEIAEVIPGGVNSPFRSFADVGGHTIFFNRAKGSIVYDVDGNRYIDYLGAWGLRSWDIVLIKLLKPVNQCSPWVRYLGHLMSWNWNLLILLSQLCHQWK